MEDIRQTKGWARYLQGCGWIVEKIGGVFVFIKKIPLTPFSMMKIQRFSEKLNFNDLKRVKKKHGVIYLVVEPALTTDSTLEYPMPGSVAAQAAKLSEERSFIPTKAGSFKMNKRPFLPTKTVMIDLKKDKKRLWGDMSTNAKRILSKKGSMFRNIELRGKEGRERFYEVWKRASKTWIMNENRFNRLLDAFGDKASLWVSESEDRILSGIILLRSKNMANYFQTFTTSHGRQTGSHYRLVWKAILDSKKRGLRWFDFEGVLDERWPQKKWAGFSEFKKKFGGREFIYSGSFVKWF